MRAVNFLFFSSASKERNERTVGFGAPFFIFRKRQVYCFFFACEPGPLGTFLMLPRKVPSGPGSQAKKTGMSKNGQQRIMDIDRKHTHL